MANTAGKSFKRWDTTVGATFSEADPPRNPKVTSIVIAAGATGGTTTLNVGGVAFLSYAVPASSVQVINFGDGVNLPDLTLAALGTNVTVTVIYE
jgi:hypothetical protein